MSFQIDILDKRILGLLTENARLPFVEIARKCRVSGAAIHQRVARMLEAGVISGSQFRLSPKGLGLLTCAFIGIQVNLVANSTHNEVFEKIQQIPEIVECHQISVKYSLLVKLLLPRLLYPWKPVSSDRFHFCDNIHFFDDSISLISPIIFS
jgi:Lrp/AsnC family transcriptional regulator for asnA, asnC and gidA